MMYGLDLFSGIGGISIALSQWIKTVAYCEADRYAQGVLLSRMQDNSLDRAPIWDDVTTLTGKQLPKIDIIFGGFPCQDISVAGTGKGLEGKRSGLFFEIIRLTKECNPRFVFLENVPAIRTRGLDTVLQEFTKIGYDCRWTMLSAADVGANHKRERWFLLAYSNSSGREKHGMQQSTLSNRPSKTSASNKQKEVTNERIMAHPNGNTNKTKKQGYDISNSDSSWKLQQKRCVEKFRDGTRNICKNVSNTNSKRLERQRKESSGISKKLDYTCDEGWWKVEPSVGRVVDELPYRMDRIKCLGNSVVPLQAKTAFEKLIYD